MIVQYRINAAEHQFPYSHNLAGELRDALKELRVQNLLLAYVGESNLRYGFRFFGEGNFQVELMKNGGAVEMSVQIGDSVNGVSPEVVRETLEEVITAHKEPERFARDYGIWGIKYEHEWPVPR